MSRPSSWSIARQRGPEGPLTGYKIAYPMISADSRRVGFNGVALGRTQVYGQVADAVCIQSPRHHPPSSWCDCGFYCFHTLDDARDLACDPQYQHCVLLEIAASGRFVRYELGLRYARQTVRTGAPRAVRLRSGVDGPGRRRAGRRGLAAAAPGVRSVRRTAARPHPCGVRDVERRHHGLQRRGRRRSRRRLRPARRAWPTTSTRPRWSRCSPPRSRSCRRASTRCRAVWSS